MSDVLDTVELKLWRSAQHTNTIYSEWQTFLESDPYGFTRRFENDAREHVYTVQVRSAVPPPLADTVRVLAGECLYHYRTSLDYLALALVPIAKRIPNIEESSQFPIHDSLPKFRSAAKHRLKGVDPAAVAAIEKLQPCYRGFSPSHSIWRLHVLANIDKHRYPVVTAAAAYREVFTIQTGFPWQLVPPTDRSLVDGAEIARFVFPTPSPDVNMKPRFACAIAFKEAGPFQWEPVWDELRRFDGLIRTRVIPSLRPFLP